MGLPFGTAEDVIRLSQRAEELGYDFVWGNDHITPPAYVRKDYADPPNWFEPLVTLAYVAAQTKRIRLGTAILVLPLRDPVWVAKQVATLDVLSHGRMMLAVGVGAYREEFERLHPRLSGSHRGDMLTEGMQVLLTIFKERSASYQGHYYSFEGLEVFPKPLQDPFPLFTGGNNENEMMRAARYGTGWMAASLPVQKLAERREFDFGKWSWKPVVTLTRLRSPRSMRLQWARPRLKPCNVLNEAECTPTCKLSSNQP